MSTGNTDSINPDDWISQADAARLRGVSRQAISKLIRKGRLTTRDLGGHTFVFRPDLERQQFGADPSVAVVTKSLVRSRNDISAILASLSHDERRALFVQLRSEFPIHPLESEFHAPAELILEAISRSPDISKRGVRGLVAEAAFELYIVRPMSQWESRPIDRHQPYDFVLADSIGEVRIQVKTQRRIATSQAVRIETGREYEPMAASRANPQLPSTMYVVETQRTRSGTTLDGQSTRPYHFGEFDILAVSMYPATDDWRQFLYTVGDWLLPRPTNATLLQVFQPVARTPDDIWTDNLEECIAWFRSGVVRSVLPPQHT